jgi:hypothetical protein
MFASYILQGIHHQGMELKDTPAPLEKFFAIVSTIVKCFLLCKKLELNQHRILLW